MRDNPPNNKPSKQNKPKQRSSSRGSMVRVMPAIKGRGDYTLIPPALAAAANVLVPGSGPMVLRGAHALGAGYEAVRNYVKKIRGSGDYDISDPKPGYNVTFNTDQIPRFSPGQRGFTVSHREFVGQVVSSATAGKFDLKTYDVSPANPAVFPWLCKLATLYNKYRIHGMVFEYRTMSGEVSGSTSTALGTVALAFTPNSNEVNPLNKFDLEQYEGVVSVKPSRSAICAVECDPQSRQYEVCQVQPVFTGTGVLGTSVSNPTIADALQRNWGKLWVSTSGVSAASAQLGELWVSYSIEFYEQRRDYNSCAASYHASGSGNPVVISDSVTSMTGVTVLDDASTGTTLKVRVSVPARYYGRVYRFVIYLAGSTSTTSNAGVFNYGCSSTIQNTSLPNALGSPVIIAGSLDMRASDPFTEMLGFQFSCTNCTPTTMTYTISLVEDNTAMYGYLAVGSIPQY